MNPFQQLVNLFQTPTFLVMFLILWGVMYRVYKYYVVEHSDNYEELNYFRVQLQKLGYNLVNADLIPNENSSSNIAKWNVSATKGNGEPAYMIAHVTYQEGHITNIKWDFDIG